MSLTEFHAPFAASRRTHSKRSKPTSHRASSKAKKPPSPGKTASAKTKSFDVNSSAAKRFNKKPQRYTQRSGRYNRSIAQSAAPRREGTKIALVIEMLARPNGVTLKELIDATGWQAHSVRGALSGALKKHRRLTIESLKVEDRGRVYKLAD